MKYTTSIKLLSALVFALTPGSGALVAVTPPGRSRTLQIVLYDSLSSYINSSIDFIDWLSYRNDDAASLQPIRVRIALQSTRSVLVVMGEISHGYTVLLLLQYILK